VNRRVRLALAVVLAVLLGGWLILNVGADSFVDVRALVQPDGSASAADPGTAGRAVVRIELSNRAPIAVTLGFRGPAFEAALYEVGSNRDLVEIWRATAEDPSLESETDSPEGAGPRVATVPSGITVAAPVFRPEPWTSTQAGSLLLRVWAYGQTSPLTPFLTETPRPSP
jgi:hypothetical protein